MSLRRRGGWFWSLVETFRVSPLRLIENGLAVVENLMVPTGV